MPASLSALVDDIRTLRAGWHSVTAEHAAHRAFEDLIEHRRIRVDTRAMTREGVQIVLSTTLRLIGDAQTDINREWLAETPAATAQSTLDAHFRAVTKVLTGWPAVLALERLAVRVIALVGTGLGIGSTIAHALAADLSTLPRVLVNDTWVIVGLALWAIAALARRGIGFRLHSLFQQGLHKAVFGA